jgi:hypothetical protein
MCIDHERYSIHAEWMFDWMGWCMLLLVYDLSDV